MLVSLCFQLVKYVVHCVLSVWSLSQSFLFDVLVLAKK